MANNYIYADVASVVSFVFPAGQTLSPLIITSPNDSGDKTGTKALRALMLPSTFPTSVLSLLASPSSIGSLYDLWALDGQNAGKIQIPVTTGRPICLPFPAFWTDCQKSFIIQSSVAMPDDMQCVALLQPLYKGGT